MTGGGETTRRTGPIWGKAPNLGGNTGGKPSSANKKNWAAADLKKNTDVEPGDLGKGPGPLQKA